MEEALELTRTKDTKERMAGVERLHQLLEASRKSLTSSEVTSLVDMCLDLLKDNNFRVSQGALQALASAAVLSGEHFKLHFNGLVPAVVERLGDAKQPVRDAARQLLLTLMEVSSSTIIVERAGSYAWTHKSWRVREEFARTVTSAIGLFASTELPLQRAILPPILQMLNDPNPGVREAAISCIEEMYTQAGPQFQDELQRHHLPTPMLKDINARLEKIEPNIRSSDMILSNYSASENKPTSLNPKKSSPKAKSSTREASPFGADGDVTEKPVEPIKVYSEKELMKEFEKIASTLVPDKDWSMRIAAMQRIEGLVIGGAADYPCFRGLLKQLVGPLNTQLSDRRSSIVKQACHLLCFLSKELLGDFESCAEMFIPVLFKLVVITVLVIAESADNCIKMMLRNCKVPRLLPRIVDCSKNDRSAVLRSRCCEYALLILEYWTDAPEIQRSADLYEDLIRYCVKDAISEVRSTARMCYRMFTKTWPERSRRLFMSFDPVVQRVINDENGGILQRHASPSRRERSSHKSFRSQTPAPSNISGYGTSAIVAMDRSASVPSGVSISSGALLSQAKSAGKGTDHSLESVLHASKQKVTAIESMLRGLDISEKSRSSSLDLGVDQPSSRDPPFPLAVPASNGRTNSFVVDATSARSKGNNSNGGLILSDIITQIQAFKDSDKLSYHSSVGNEPLLAPSSYSAKRASEKLQEKGLVEEKADVREARKYKNSHVDAPYLDAPYKDFNHRDSQNNYMPNFQRPLLRKNAAVRMSPHRSSFDDTQVALVDISSYSNGPASLNDAFSEGLSSGSDWSARVLAFSYIRSLLQKGPRGIQEIVQSFEKVMKLFFQHLDDPHHKVAQAALSTLADLYCCMPYSMLRNCKVPRLLPRIVDCSKNDRSAVLRSRCCEYALLILEYWTDAPEIQRSADLYEDLIRYCVKDAISEVRSTARMCYRMFTKTWPERSRRLFMSFDPVVQRVINDENGGILQRHASPSRRERSSHKSFRSQTPAPSNISGYGTSAIVAMDRSASVPSGVSISSGALLSQAKSAGKGTDHSLESVLHASKQKVTAIESMLRGLDISEKSRSSSLDLVQELTNHHLVILHFLLLFQPQSLILKDAMEDSFEIVIEKLLHVTKDSVSDVSNELEPCLSIMLSEYDPFRCLSVIVPLLVTEDGRTLIICINCLTKIVSRLSQEELVAQLPSFLPALFDAFGNQSADVRKTVVFCLVDTYIKLGKAFLPYLEGLNATQLRLVTIYANRISQARNSTPIDATL
ncbi:CLIP-associated protein-like [Olea europaea var. sylvestris]|uniref:CLIP-associated protein-like n=1 Tax=Olea europaea var. sylvestris TaxID=158386 RepID=UPI000C1D6DE7|nr:CLIP-associated protein-like [Olea europaea var. sylvestris]